MKKIFVIFCLSIAVLGSFKTLYKLTAKFRVYKIVPQAPLNANLNTSSFDAESVQGILDQEYHYLGKGRQLFAFVSQDGKYVLKFFRIDKLKPRFWSQFSSGLHQKHIASKKKKHTRWLKSFQLAFDKLKTETGMIALHLEQTGDLNRQVKLTDRIGRKHIVDLDQTYFILQEKCDPLTSTLQGIEDRDQMTQIIDSFLSVTLSRYQNSIDNQTRRCLDNIGVKDNRVIEFDMGEFIERENQWQDLEDYRESYVKFTDALLHWFLVEKPEYSSLLVERRAKILGSMTTQQVQSQTSDQTKLDRS